MGDIITQLFAVFLPVVQGIIKDWKSSHNGATPTDAEILTTFNANIAKGLADGAAWKATHPQV